jgi:predicted nuclease with TOPRIM domain
MSVVDDSDFLTSRAKQLAAVNELANLRTRLVDLQAELLNRQQERRQIILRVAEQDLTRQEASGRSSRTEAIAKARASEEVRTFDRSVSSLRERIRRLEIDVERVRLSISVAIAGAERPIGLVGQRGAA